MFLNRYRVEYFCEYHEMLIHISSLKTKKLRITAGNLASLFIFQKDRLLLHISPMVYLIELVGHAQDVEEQDHQGCNSLINLFSNITTYNQYLR